MVSFSCESCGDVLTKKKLDPHRGRCNAQFTCLDCQTTFKGTEYRAHTSCISEAQKYQGKLYKEPKKGPKPKQHKTTSAPAQTLVEKKAKMEDPIMEPDSRIALVEMVPRAPTPPAAFNVFDFLVQNGNTPAPSAHPLDAPGSSDSESSSEEDEKESSSSEGEEEDSDESDSDSMDTDDLEQDPVQNAADAAREYMRAELLKQGFAHPSAVANPFETPAPARGHQRNISTTSADSATKESTKKRKRGSPEELDLSSAKQYRANADVVMTDVPPALHSGLTGGLKTLLSRPELPPSPPDVDSPNSPLKRSKQAKTHKAIKSESSAKKEKKESKKSKTKEKESRKEKEKEKKDKSKEGKTVVVKDPKTGQWIRKRVRKDSTQTSETPVEPPPSASAPTDPAALQRSKQQLAIEYSNGNHAADEALPATSSAVVVHSRKAVSRAESFLATAVGDADQARGRGCSVKKALKRFSKERGRKAGAAVDLERELWKVLRMRRNERGEVVLFVEGGL